MDQIPLVCYSSFSKSPIPKGRKFSHRVVDAAASETSSESTSKAVVRVSPRYQQQSALHSAWMSFTSLHK
ncbi:hypothetical protein CgunFtcFv8_016698 [Champsocephalus gunnari]|uniref:Uncharacterized protein n=1 Tax=Champsocephalus gunnari TaxID=52237 RepID=A0AAN8HAP7_CHAGU|nr:hypothetical protein CgunFtcFv8_016698 [Champsocephalus gunnari]